MHRKRLDKGITQKFKEREEKKKGKEKRLVDVKEQQETKQASVLFIWPSGA